MWDTRQKGAKRTRSHPPPRPPHRISGSISDYWHRFTSSCIIVNRLNLARLCAFIMIVENAKQRFIWIMRETGVWIVARIWAERHSPMTNRRLAMRPFVPKRRRRLWLLFRLFVARMFFGRTTRSRHTVSVYRNPCVVLKSMSFNKALRTAMFVKV